MQPSHAHFSATFRNLEQISPHEGTEPNTCQLTAAATAHWHTHRSIQPMAIYIISNDLCSLCPRTTAVHSHFHLKILGVERHVRLFA